MLWSFSLSLRMTAPGQVFQEQDQINANCKHLVEGKRTGQWRPKRGRPVVCFHKGQLQEDDEASQLVQTVLRDRRRERSGVYLTPILELAGAASN
jgi:hypothetical protein